MFHDVEFVTALSSEPIPDDIRALHVNTPPTRKLPQVPHISIFLQLDLNINSMACIFCKIIKGA